MQAPLTFISVYFINNMTQVYAKNIANVPTEVIIYAPKRVKRLNKNKSSLHNWNTVPDFMRDNEFIRSGYRANWTFRNALKSLFQIHNETGNVWTHLVGFILFFCLTLYVAMAPPSSYIVPHEPLDNLWSSVQNNLHSLGDHIGEGVNSLQDSVKVHTTLLSQELRQSILALHTNLEIKAEALKSHFNEHLDVAKHVLQENLSHLRSNLRNSFISLSTSIVLFQTKIEHVAENLNSKITNAKNNLELSYTALQESLNNLQENVSENLGGLKQSVVRSFSHLHENLHNLQEILNEHYAMSIFGNEHDDVLRDNSTQCPSNLELEIKNIHFPTHLLPVVRWPVYVFMFGAMLCMLASSVCHLFGCCSKHVASWMWRFDYVGIAILIVASCYPPIYYGFMCNPDWMKFYLSIISILGSAVIVACLSRHFQTPKLRPVRAMLFSALGLWGAFPLIHLLILHQNIPIVRTASLYEIAMGTAYLAGAALYAARIPERFKPGAFDVAFHSHQIFHAAVVLGAYLHFHATMLFMQWRESSWGCYGPS